MPTIAIFSTCADLHSHSIDEVLRRKGHKSVWFHGPDYPCKLSVTMETDRGNCVSSFAGIDEALTASQVGAVWVRRAVEHSIYPEWHARLEREEARNANREAFEMRRNFLGVFAPAAYWINPYYSIIAADNKAAQLQRASAVGFTVPQTLMSNSPERIREFLHRHEGKVIYKSCSPVGVSTTRIGHTSLPDNEDLIRILPGIFQALVEKDYELRVTVMGNRVFAYRIESQSTRKGKIDWRDAYDEIDVAAVTLPELVNEKCRRLCRSLNLEYGAIDIIVTPEADYVFLEVNESGQFTFLENMAIRLGNPAHALVDAFTEMLIQADRNFHWDGRQAHLWGADDDIHHAARSARAESMLNHNYPEDMGGIVDGTEQAQFNALLEHNRKMRAAASEQSAEGS